MTRWLTHLILLLATITFARPVPAASNVQGMLTSDGVTGREVGPHGWMEEKAYVCPVGSGTGSGTTTSHTPPGWFRIEGLFPPGPYAAFTLKYDGIPAFDFTNFEVPESSDSVEGISVRNAAHYSVMYNEGHHEWGEEPWVHGSDFYQTFVAAGPYVTRIATRLADKRPEYTGLNLNYAIYKPNDAPPSSWERVSPVRSRFLSPTTDPIIHIFWVPFRSNEMKLIPGERYAVRLWRGEGSTSEEFTLVARRDNGTGYAKGHLFIDDTPQENWDAFLYVSGGAPGTIVNHAPIESFDLKEFLGWNNRFGQTFRATGKGLAAVDVIFARTTDLPLNTPVTFQVYDGVGGEPIGPAKTCHGVPGAFQARAAVSWAPGEVPLEPGKTYYVECTSEGLNVWRMEEDIPGVQAYVEGESKAPHDAMMSIVEYGITPEPIH